MKDLDPFVFLAVFQEMLGPLLWVLIGLALFGIAAFIVLLVREGGLVHRRFVLAQAVGILGGFAALVIMAKVTLSGFTDAGGPVDWLLICAIWGGGFVGATVLAYVAQGYRGLIR